MISGVFAKPGSGRAITDVYDPQDRRILVRFPTLLVSLLAIAGVLAFGMVGYLGYQSDSTIVKSLFEKAWPLFLWFSALVFALEIAVLRHHRLRRYLIEALIVTLISMVFVGVAAVFPDAVTQFLSNLLNIHIYIPQIGDSPWTYTILNFGIILVFWVDTVRRWMFARVARARGDSPRARVLELGIGTLEFGEEGDLPTLPELIAGDLIAGGVLVALLSLVFQDTVLGPVATALQTGAQITTCTVSWPIGCNPTLSRIDIIQALIYLPLGFITLALTATQKAFDVASETEQSATGSAGAAVSTPWVDDGQALNADLHPVAQSGNPDVPAGERGSGRVRRTVVEVIIDALRAPLQRRIRLVIDNLLLALRNVVWPLFILLGMVALGQASKSIAFYLRTQSNQRNCAARLDTVVGGAQKCQEVAGQIASGLQYGSLAEGVGLVIVAAIAIVAALMMLVFSLRVATNTFRFLGVVAWIAALTLWLFSLTLSVSNALFNLVGLTQREPFPILGVSTTASLLVFLFACLFLVLGQARSAKRRAVRPAVS